MNEEQQKRYDELRNEIKVSQREKEFLDNVLLQECIQFTGSEVFRNEVGEAMIDEIEAKIERDSYGKVICEQFSFFENIEDLKRIFEIVDESQKFYLYWCRWMPCLKNALSEFIECIDDVEVVGGDFLIVSLDYNIVIEFYHEGEVMVGIFNQ